MEDNRLDKRAMEAFAGEFTPKFLATASEDGTPNIVPIISIEAWNPQTLVFGELMMWKTKKNLLANPKMGASVFTADMNSWSVKGDFDRFERTGEIYDRLNMHEMYRYNAYTGLRNAGVINIKEAWRERGMMSPGRIAEMAMIAATVKKPWHGFDGPMPPQVSEKFSRVKAAKYLSYIGGDGYPLAVPVLSLAAAGHDALVFGAGALLNDEYELPEPPFRAAACVITFDPVAYQVKGTVTEYTKHLGVRIGRLEVDEVYSASPPLPGKRIDVGYDEAAIV